MEDRIIENLKPCIYGNGIVSIPYLFIANIKNEHSRAFPINTNILLEDLYDSIIIESEIDKLKIIKGSCYSYKDELHIRIDKKDGSYHEFNTRSSIYNILEITRVEESDKPVIEENNTEMVKKKSWDEFRSTGLLWFINQALHVFGWAIVCSYDDNGNLIGAYPARVKYRGFSIESQEQGYYKISKYMKECNEELYNEAKIE